MVSAVALAWRMQGIWAITRLTSAGVWNRPTLSPLSVANCRIRYSQASPMKRANAMKCAGL